MASGSSSTIRAVGMNRSRRMMRAAGTPVLGGHLGLRISARGRRRPLAVASDSPGRTTGIIIGQARPSGQDGGDPRPARLHALGEDPSAMHLHELLGNTQAKAQPALAEAEIARGMPAGVELGEERLEQVLERLGLQADAAILDHDLRLVRRVEPGRQLDLAAVGRELDRVGQQVDQDRADLVGVDLERPQVVGQLGPGAGAGGR